MIKIICKEDIQRIPDKAIIPYINSYFDILISTYPPNCSLEAVGAIFFLESKEDFKNLIEFGLSSPLMEERFEWIDGIGEGYSNGCIVLNNDFAINIIAKDEYFDWS